MHIICKQLSSIEVPLAFYSFSSGTGISQRRILYDENDISSFFSKNFRRTHITQVRRLYFLFNLLFSPQCPSQWTPAQPESRQRAWSVYPYLWSLHAALWQSQNSSCSPGKYHRSLLEPQYRFCHSQLQNKENYC